MSMYGGIKGRHGEGTERPVAKISESTSRSLHTPTRTWVRVTDSRRGLAAQRPRRGLSCGGD